MPTETQLDRIEHKLDLIGDLVCGDGNPQKGLVLKVALLESRAKRIDAIQKVVVTAVLLGFVTAVWAVLRGRS